MCLTNQQRLTRCFVCSPARDQSWDQRVYILSAISTPPLPKSSSGGGGGWNRVDWFTEHARQVRRMLVGGVEIVGMFVADSNADRAREAEGAVRDMLYGLPLSAGAVDCILLRATGAAKGVTGEVYSGTKKEAVKPKPITSIKVANIAPSLVAFETTLYMDVTIPVHPVSSASSSSSSTSSSSLSSGAAATAAVPLKLQLRKGLESFQASVMAAQATVNGASVDGALVLDKAFESDNSSGSSSSSAKSKGKGGKGSKKGSSSSKSDSDPADTSAQLVEFFLRPTLLAPADPNATGTVRLQGSCHSRVYAHNKYTVAQALLSLKHDVLNSLQSRLQLLCEDSEDALGSFDLPADGSSFTWSLPRRLFQPLVRPACVCDYLLPHEQEEDGVRRIAELLGVQHLAEQGGPPFTRERCSGEGEEPEESIETEEEPTSANLTDSSSNSSANRGSSSTEAKSVTASSSTSTAVAQSSSSSLLLPLAFAVLLLALSAAFLLQLR